MTTRKPWGTQIHDRLVVRPNKELKQKLFMGMFLEIQYNYVYKKLKEETITEDNCVGQFIIIIFYLENVAFFHAKLGSDVCSRVDNKTSGDTLQDLTRPLVEKSPSASYPPMGIGASFWWWDALPHQPVGIREETLESGNLFSGSWISASVP